jgi:hypothetical protein
MIHIIEKIMFYLKLFLSGKNTKIIKIRTYALVW